MKNAPDRSMRHNKGNIFLALFGAVALAALLSYAVSQFIRGPLTTSTNLTRSNTAKQQMTVAAQLVLATSATQTAGAGNGDCDSDNFIEPLEYRDGTTVPHPTGGGYLPNAVGAMKKDPWGTEYGYCAWDAGSVITSDNNATCGGTSAKRLDGAKTTVTHPNKPNTQAIIAVISAGKDKAFQTTCNGFVDLDDNADPDVTLVDKTVGSDDIIVQYTYNEAREAGGDLWTLKTADPGTATIAKNVEIAPGQSLDFGLGSRLLIPTSLELTDADCTGTSAGQVNDGALRLNITTMPPSLEVCYDTDIGVGTYAWDWGSSGGSSVGSIDDLSDGIADYTTLYNLFLGETAGDSITTGNYNIAIGRDALTANTTGHSFVAIGDGALSSMNNPPWANGSVAIGRNALRTKTGGYSSIAIGYYAAETAPGDNTIAIGNLALRNNNSHGNVCIGNYCIGGSGAGRDNVAIGTSVMADTTGGSYNVAIGTEALRSNTTAAGSTAIGYQAMYYANNAGGGPWTYNTAVGYLALRGSTTASANTGTSNTALGFYSLLSNTSGSRNVAIGAQTASVNAPLYANTTGSSNVAMGPGALSTNVAGSNSTAIGYESMRYSNSSSTAFAANNTALGYQALRGTTTASSNTGRFNIAIGYKPMVESTSGSYNIAIGSGDYAGALGFNSSGKNNIAIGASDEYSCYSAMQENRTGTDNVAIGSCSMGYSWHKSRNTSVGAYSMRNSDSNGWASETYNTAVGWAAMMGSSDPFANTGTSNTAIGSMALRSYTSGSQNAALGVTSLYSNTTGGNNTALGLSSLYSNTTGVNNSASGLQAMYANTIGGNNVAVGVNSLYTNVAGSQSTAVGRDAMRYANSSGTAFTTYNTAVGYQALRGSATASANIGTYNTALGHSALLSNTDGSLNTAIGTNALTANTSGGGNVAVGSSAGNALISGQDNVFIGHDAGTSISVGQNNIFIGAYADNGADGDYLLNIGNTLYGDTNTQQLNLGSSTLVSGISLDVGSKTDSIRPAVGTTAQEPVCDSTRYGAMRYDTTRGSMMVCTSTGWNPLLMTSSGGGTTSTPAAGTGYFVVTYGTWTGNLGGISGANAKCLSDLQTYNWQNKSDAVSRGILNATNVQAWICGGACQEALPNTTYTFAASGYPSTGGATFLTDASGYLPGNSENWSGTNYFGSARTYWTNHATGSSTISNGGPNGGGTCTTFTNTTGNVVVGISNSTNASRWSLGATQTCASSYNLACLVNPGNESSVVNGYFVMTDTTYDGNVGNLSGANTRCLTELTTNTNWMGYTDANAAGRLVAGKVFAFLCHSTGCNNLNPSTTYQFGIVGDDTIGGATFTTDTNSRGPNDSSSWAGSNYFGGNYDWWSNRSTVTGAAFGTVSALTYAGTCNDMTSNSSSGISGYYGNTAQTDAKRWFFNTWGCNGTRRLICYVNP